MANFFEENQKALKKFVGFKSGSVLLVHPELNRVLLILLNASVTDLNFFAIAMLATKEFIE